jgi:hypothetical protein
MSGDSVTREFTIHRSSTAHDSMSNRPDNAVTKEFFHLDG